MKWINKSQVIILQNTTMNDSIQVKSIKIPHGEGKRIAQKVLKTPSYVSQVLSGKHFDKEILSLAAEVNKGNADQLNIIKTRIENYLNR